MRIVFMGTGDIAIPAFRSLVRNSDLVGLVTQPDRPVGRHQVLTAPAIKNIAREAGIPVLQPHSLRTPDALINLKRLNPDLIAVMAYGQILSQEVIDMAPMGCINAHASLLPRHRGAACIQSAIKSFGSTVGAGSSASSNLEGFVYTAMNAFAQAAVTFTSQNMGARKYHNLDRVMRNCLLCAVVTGILLGGGAALAGRQLLHFYSSDEAVIAAGYERLWIICGTYLLCGIMDTLASSLRGLGYSVLPMVVSLIGSCLLRLVWIATIFQLNRTPFMLYISYPISWVLTASVHLICLLVVRRKLQKKGQNLQAA